MSVSSHRLVAAVCMGDDQEYPTFSEKWEFSDIVLKANSSTYHVHKVRYHALKVCNHVHKVRYHARKVRYHVHKVRYHARKVRYHARKVRYHTHKVRYHARKVRYHVHKVRYHAHKLRYHARKVCVFLSNHFTMFDTMVTCYMLSCGMPTSQSHANMPKGACKAL